jgi:hypothetical protein
MISVTDHALAGDRSNLFMTIIDVGKEKTAV